MTRTFVHLIETISHWTGEIVSWFVFAILGVLLFELIARNFFGLPSVWAHESSGILFGSYYLLAGAYVLSIRGHVSIDIVSNRLSERKQRILDILTFPFFFIVCIVLIYWGGKLALHAWEIGEKSQSLWQPPMAPVRSLIPIGAVLLLLQGVAKLIVDINKVITGRHTDA